MICYICGQPAVGQCQSCRRFYCKEHGDLRCQNCAPPGAGEARFGAPFGPDMGVDRHLCTMTAGRYPLLLGCHPPLP
jgi:hypothetical protein